MLEADFFKSIKTDKQKRRKSNASWYDVMKPELLYVQINKNRNDSKNDETKIVQMYSNMTLLLRIVYSTN